MTVLHENHETLRLQTPNFKRTYRDIPQCIAVHRHTALQASCPQAMASLKALKKITGAEAATEVDIDLQTLKGKMMNEASSRLRSRLQGPSEAYGRDGHHLQTDAATVEVAPPTGRWQAGWPPAPGWRLPEAAASSGECTTQASRSLPLTVLKQDE